MRVLFIYPNLHAQIGFNYGIAYISGVLKAHGIETQLLNVNDQVGYPLDLERIKDDVLRIKPDLIGFSVLTNQYKYALEIAGSIKTYLNVPIVFGGIHPTMDPKGVLAEGPVDYICVGEGEEAFLELIEKGAPEGIRNIGYKKNGELIIAPLRPFRDIAHMPFKDYDIFDFQQMIDAKDGWVGLTASRGCPFRCTYCLNHKIMALYKKDGHLPKTYLRRHTVDEVIGEIEYLLERYKRIKMFIFDDDIFTFDKAWLHRFSERYRETTRIPFVCNAHARVFDREMAKDLEGSGCRIVKFGLESGSERIRRDVLNRYMTNDQIAKAFGVAHEFGFHTSAFVMIGMPHEKEEDIMETVKLLGRIQPGRFRWTLFFPFIGTRAYDIALDAGMIDFAKMKALDNFTDETCMILGEEVSLLIDKLKTLFCVFVNGYGNMDGEWKYLDLTKRVESLTREEWAREKESIMNAVSGLDAAMERAGKPFYRVKYNPFMGVRSDWTDDSISA
jgi:anaerobic magnesium-protoporphyrin IX monomethyl ester cyclase